MKLHPVKTDGDPQLGKAEHIASLVIGYIRKSLNHVEHDELDEWVAEKDDNMLLFEEITDEKRLQNELEMLDESQLGHALKKCKGKLSFK
jgi:hypothetical protein